MSGEVDPHRLVEGAIKGIFDALADPFSSYLTEEEYRASLGGLSGEFEGVGIEMATLENGEACQPISDTCLLTVTRVIRGSPAIAAGIEQDDVVTAVDGATTIGQTLEEVVPTIRGPKGSTVVLTIRARRHHPGYFGRARRHPARGRHAARSSPRARSAT